MIREQDVKKGIKVKLLCAPHGYKNITLKCFYEECSNDCCANFFKENGYGLLTGEVDGYDNIYVGCGECAGWAFTPESLELYEENDDTPITPLKQLEQQISQLEEEKAKIEEQLVSAKDKLIKEKFCGGLIGKLVLFAPNSRNERGKRRMAYVESYENGVFTLKYVELKIAENMVLLSVNHIVKMKQHDFLSAPCDVIKDYSVIADTVKTALDSIIPLKQS